MAPGVTIQNTDVRNVLEMKQNIPKPQPVPNKDPKGPAQQPPQPQKISRRSSKPIINWFQRKIAATVKPRRHVQGVSRGDAEDKRGKTRVPPTVSVRAPNRVASSPVPINSSSHKGGTKQQLKLEIMTHARRKTISLNGDDEGRDFYAHHEAHRSSDVSSLARGSVSSAISALEADEDASLRPIAPSPPPSPSRSSSSYLSDPRTFRSMAASTKPTTLLSVDMTPTGMAHIAQVPMTQVTRISPHIRTPSTNTTPGLIGSGNSVTFSALPPSPQSSRPSSLQNPASINSSNPSSQQTPQVISPISSVQAPLHTTHHPRNNPRPSSPPLENASMLTLASSAFALPGSRVGVAPGWSSSAPSAVGWDDSLSHFGGSIAGDGYPDAESTSQFVVGDDDRLEERDVDASVRALRPRSSRRGSWGSEASGWSARVHGGTPSLPRERSLWTTNSVRTGGQFTADNDTGDQSAENDESEEPSLSEAPPEASSSHAVEFGEDVAHQLPTSTVGDSEPTPKLDIPVPTLAPPVLLQGTHSTDTVALITPIKDDDPPKPHERVDDDHNLTSPDREVWHSAPSTPMISVRSD